jgi:hypothetical protein
MINRSKVVLSTVVAGAVALTTSVQALPSISGTIEFNGGATVNNGNNLATATAFNSITGVTVLGGDETGSYASLNGGGSFGGTTFNTFSFGGNTLSPNPVTLWTVINGGTTYSFEATSVIVGPNPRSSTFLNLSGTGIASITGFQDTVATWSITDTTQGGPEVTFSASVAAVAPENSTTIMLLGLGLTGLALFAKVRQQAVA